MLGHRSCGHGVAWRGMWHHLRHDFRQWHSNGMEAYLATWDDMAGGHGLHGMALSSCCCKPRAATLMAASRHAPAPPRPLRHPAHGALLHLHRSSVQRDVLSRCAAGLWVWQRMCLLSLQCLVLLWLVWLQTVSATTRAACPCTTPRALPCRRSPTDPALTTRQLQSPPSLAARALRAPPTPSWLIQWKS